ncbi:inositol 1,4,5-triphosphate receptor associated 2-like [Hypomesus transpacificus]|uniref:inositol 1,4,5-triphosphate receptor associated 2-like n=1 Tax=Hypomesus transpacificus TaxID=137520 RepID=UPI001F07614C|nr:inositol 1,4,5-triphosphate receptor associated 2-like [Hypomesus transpacificus]
MSVQLPHESAQCEYAGILGDSDDSDEEPCPSDKLAVAWDDLPILERLGLTSGADMTEEEVESEFSKLAMAFRCDQYTLSQRLQAEEHDRAVAQENLTLELQQARESLEALRGRCADSERSHMLSCIDTSLDTVLGSMEDVISAAEMLGAVHQDGWRDSKEARVSCSVELMQTHMQHLKLRHSAHNVQLQETRKLLHRCRGRIHSDSAEDGDVRQLFVRQGSQQHLMRRRVSVTLLPTQAQLSDLEVRFTDGCRAGGDTDSQGPTESAVSHTTSTSPSHSPAERSFQSTQSLEEDNDPSSRPMALRHRRKSAIQEWEGSIEEAEVKESTTGSPTRPGANSTEELSQLSSSDSVSVDQLVIPTQQRPLQSWLSFLCCILLVLACFLLCFLWIVLSLPWGFAYSHRNGHTAI